MTNFLPKDRKYKFRKIKVIGSCWIARMLKDEYKPWLGIRVGEETLNLVGTTLSSYSTRV